MTNHRAQLDQERSTVAAQLVGLRRDFGDIVDASADSNADDEHDPEGSTIAFERAQVVALIQQAEQRLSEIDAAQRRVADGIYGICEVCNEPIFAGRLVARPTARTCVGHT